MSDEGRVMARGGAAPREWTIEICERCGEALGAAAEYSQGAYNTQGEWEYDTHAFQMGDDCGGIVESVTVVERASLDRVVEERDELREAIDHALPNIALYADEKNYERQGNLMPAQIGSGSYARLAVNQLRAALRSGEGERHEG